MKTTIIVIIILIVVLVVIGLIFSQNNLINNSGNNNLSIENNSQSNNTPVNNVVNIPTNHSNAPVMNNQPSTNNQNNQSVNNSQGNNQPPVLQKTISIVNFSFIPESITVNVGAIITWTNNDTITHQIAGDTFNSNPLNSGDSFTFTFNQAGTFTYHCAIHPFMMGQIIVIR